MPTQSALPMKKKAKRIYVTLKAFFRYRLGNLTSPDSMERYSGPTTVKAALQRQPRKPSNLPRLPVVICSTKAPGFFPKRSQCQWTTSLGEKHVILKVTEAICILLRATTNHGNECEGKHDTNEEDLSDREPEFGLPVPFYYKRVDATGIVVKAPSLSIG